MNLFNIFSKSSPVLVDPLKSDPTLARELQFIGTLCQPLQKLPEDIIINQGSQTSQLYFLSKGNCNVTCTDFAGTKTDIRILHPGAIFGEISYLLKCLRTTTVKSHDYTSLLYLPRAEGYQFMHLSALLKDQFMKYKDKS